MRGAPRFEPVGSCTRVTVRVAIVAVVIGVFCTWLAQRPRDPQRGRGAEQRLAAASSWPSRPFLWVEVDGARLPGWRRRRARECVRDRLDGRRELASTRSASWTPMSPTACSSSSRRARCWQRSPSSARLRFSATPPARARTRPAVGDGQPWPSPSSCSRFSSSSSSGRCSGSRSGRAGRRRRTRSRRRAREAATEAFAARDGTRPHDADLDFAWSTAATIEPWVEGQDVLPADLRRREGGAVVRPHPHVRLARGPGRDGDGRPARAEARGGCRGAGDRRRLRLAAERRREGDVHRARRSRCADRRQRRASPRPRRSLPGPSPPRLAPGRGRPCRPPEALRDRRRGRVDRGRGNRGPLRERRLPRRDGARHGRRRPPGAGGLPDELPRPRRPPARRPRPLLPRAGRRRRRFRSRLRRSSPAGSSPPRRRSASRSTARAGGST